VTLGDVAASTPGMVGADLRALVNEAALTAARRRHSSVGAMDFSDALERVLLGAERRIIISPEERTRTAYHEAGHALLATLVPGAEVVRKVSIVPHGQALGVTLQSPQADRHGYTEEELLGRVVTALGGRAAEEIVFGRISTGAEDDLAQVARIARQMVERWGMSSVVGPNAILPAQEAGVLTPASGAVSEETRRLVDGEVRRVVDAAHEEALRLLRANRDRLEALAAALLERETLDEAEVLQIAGSPPAAVSGAAVAPSGTSATAPTPREAP
jgi:cell division protease FtsH